jgi:ABC-type bacteriocin/lantibiotic exporter with double-glycine peptidase domain
MDQGKLAAITFRCFSMLDTLKSTGGENHFLTMWTGHHAKVINAEQTLGRLRLILVGLPIFLSSVSTTTIIVVGGSRVMDGAMSIGMLLAFQTLNAAFSAPVQGLMQLGTQFQEAQAAVGRLDDVLKQDFAPEFLHKPSDLPTRLRLRLSGPLVVDKICFGFSPLDLPIINEFSIDVPPGSRIALVGGSGSGKSTIGKMIAGFYRPSSGRITIDNVPLESVTREELRSTIGYVYQSTALFPASVRANICLWDTTIPEERIIAAARDALIHDVISRRPNGYEHVVAENGRNFSGGQRQRIALARALALEPAILILDEATSALDAATEAAFMQNLRRRGCAAILIAHRLSTIRDCDEIVVLERGSVVERGRHDDLIRQDGSYRALLGH